MKNDSKATNSRKVREDCLVKLLTLVLFSKILSAQMLIVYSSGVVVITTTHLHSTKSELRF